MSEGELKERRARRVTLSCRVFFFGEDDFEGEGKMLECSTTGCRMISDRPVVAGQLFSLSLFLQDVPWPLRIERTVVRWTNGPEFGVEFVDIRSSVRERLRLVLMKTKRRISVQS